MARGKGNGSGNDTVAKIMSAMNNSVSIEAQVADRARELFDAAMKKRDTFEDCLAFVYTSAIEDMQKVAPRKRKLVPPHTNPGGGRSHQPQPGELDDDNPL